MAEKLFIGSAVSTISARGELLLPEHFCIAIQSRGMREDLFIGLHAADPCLLVYDGASAGDHHDELTQNWESDTRDTLLRRRLGFVAPAHMDGKGRVVIASWMRSRRGVRQRALLVGMGRHFEVWNLDQVIEEGPADLAILATLHLASQKLASPNLESPTIKEDHHELALSRLGARRRAARPGKSGVPVQPVPAVPARPDPLRPVLGRAIGSR